MEDTIMVTDALKEKLGLPVHEVSGAFDEYGAPIILGGGTLDDLVAFIKDAGSKIVFAEYNYTDEDELLVNIDNDMLKELFPEDWEEAREFIDEHNGHIMEEDWDAPYAMDVFVMYEGQPFGVRIYNDAYDDDLLIEPEDYITDMIDGLIEIDE